VGLARRKGKGGATKMQKVAKSIITANGKAKNSLLNGEMKKKM
jgi:hypothetical protein